MASAGVDDLEGLTKTQASNLVGELMSERESQRKSRKESGKSTNKDTSSISDRQREFLEDLVAQAEDRP